MNTCVYPVHSEEHWKHIILTHGTCRYHGLFWNVSHQVEERRDGVTSESWIWLHLQKRSLLLFNSFIKSEKIKDGFQQRVQPPVDFLLLRLRCWN